MAVEFLMVEFLRDVSLIAYSLVFNPILELMLVLLIELFRTI